ncbi:hypothetical protein L211DRAFT_879837 [Terfezia boudieri ATCC MYA-4762]|uniref:Uncharacterized protein n=1 Tax=Terfezia boudieri ATCC MYA-4762 TaxID=1051890 RepID=A0A3N4LR88_9PEZI|nr:hypothetical protein L211DRAFT_879837 [Terfezia boudieri ATCC MYA-4762]
MGIYASTTVTGFASPPPSTSPSPSPSTSPQAISTPLPQYLTVNLMKSMLSRKIQALLTLVVVGIATYIGFANGTSRTVDPAGVAPPPGHHAQCTQMCLGVGAACIQELKGEIEDMNLRMEERFRGLWGLQTAGHSIEMVQECGGMKAAGMTELEMRVGKVEEKLVKVDERVGKVEEKLVKVDERIVKVEERIVKVEERIAKIEGKLAKIEGGYPSVQSSTVRIPCFDKQAVWQLDMERRVDRIEERLASIENSINDINNNLRTLLQKLDDQRVDHKQDGGGREREKDGEDGGKASVEVKTKEFAAIVNGFPVVGLVIGIWVTIVLYVLYSKEWLARRDRRWRIRDDLRETQGNNGKGEEGKIACVLM